MAWPVASPDATARSPGSNKPDANLHLPRILCLHGGGTNSRIFRAQCRVIRARLAPHFRLVFAEAPFPSPPGPDVQSVYAEWGPFRSWVPVFSQLDIDAATVMKVDAQIASAIAEDNAAGATGTVVGLLGFSQGARMAASLLLRQQKQQDQYQHQMDGGWTDYRFAVLMAGRGPLLSMDRRPHYVDEANRGRPDANILLRLPTIHVHGLRDAGIEAHRNLLNNCCQKGTTRLIEWDGDHRVPIKSKDVSVLVAMIMDVASSVDLIF